MLFSTSVVIALIFIFGGLFFILVVCFIYSAINQQVISKEDAVKKENKRITKIRYRSAMSLNQDKNKK